MPKEEKPKLACAFGEGYVFAVPLRSGGYAAGVAARVSADGRMIYGYFFPPRASGTTDIHFGNLRPHMTVYRSLFGDLALHKGKWPLLGLLPNWDRNQWRMPAFVLRPMGATQLIIRSDLDPSVVVSIIDVSTNIDGPLDGLDGCGAVETVLDMVLSGGSLPGRHSIIYADS